MTPEQFDSIIERLDKIVALLEMQVFGVETCAHENAVDRGAFGMRPGERMECTDCGETFSRIE
jgi:hypothetical protein